jgi:hypothetical protein
MRNDILFDENNINDNENLLVNNDEVITNNLIYINKNEISLIKASMPAVFLRKKKDEMKDKNDLIKYKKEELNRKNIEKNYKLCEGIIYVYNSQKNNTISLIYQIVHKFKNDEFTPIIIIGNRMNLEGELTKNDKNYFNRLKNIIFIEPSNDIKNCIVEAIKEIFLMKKINQNYENFKKDNGIKEAEIINSIKKIKENILRCLY